MLSLQIETIHIHFAAIACIAMYYAMSYPAIKAAKTSNTTSFFRKGSQMDYLISFLILAAPVGLLIVLPTWSSFISLPLHELLAFYFYFLFFFAFIYCESNWHFSGALTEVQKDDWAAELRYFVISLQTQTTLGYTRTRPNNIATELFSGLQALIGVLFVAVVIAKAVGQVTIKP